MSQISEKQSAEKWATYRLNVQKSTFTVKESPGVKKLRIERLLSNSEEFFKYYFEKFATAEPANFQKKATKRIIENDVWFEVRAWFRAGAKSVRAMMEWFYLKFTGKTKNLLLISYSKSNADELLMPFMIQLESNQRIINDYGVQKSFGNWQDGNFKTNDGCSLRAIGSGQSPRGTRNEEARPDFIMVDDLDEDELCRNDERLNAAFEWLTGALFPCFDIAGTKRFLMIGNIIAKRSLVVQAAEKADYFEIINIYDSKGNPSWSERYTHEQCQYMIDKIPYAMSQREYFNNPIIIGSIFKEVIWAKCPVMRTLKYVVNYGDPAPSNRENKINCYKVVVLIGEQNGTFYIYNCRLDHVNNAKFIDWYYEIEDSAPKGMQIYNYIENNSLQDPFYEQVFIPLFLKAGETNEHYIHVRGDDRKKPDKFTRIEGNLEPLNRNGKLIFNIDEINNPHMKRLEEQFLAVNQQLSAPVDGPDAVEGGVYILNNKRKNDTPPTVGYRYQNKKRY